MGRSLTSIGDLMRRFEGVYPDMVGIAADDAVSYLLSMLDSDEFDLVTPEYRLALLQALKDFGLR